MAGCVTVLTLAFPLVALSAPVDEAVRLLGENRHQDAARVLEPIVAANPFDGMAAYYLGVALARSGRCAEALPHLDAAFELGANGERNGMRSVCLRAAECLAQMGHAEASAARVHEAWAHWSAADVPRLTAGDVYAPLRDRGLLQPLSGRTPEADAGDSIAQRRADLAYFDRLIRETHPSPFHRTPEPEWRAAVAGVSARLAQASPARFNIDLMRLAAMVGDGHTSVFPQSEGPNAWRLMPIYPLRLSDGWVIAAAAPVHRELVGARIDSVAGRSIDEVFAQIRACVSGDNEMTPLWLGGVALQTYEVYAELGLASRGAVTFQVSLATGARRSVRIEAGPIDRDPNARWTPAGWPALGKETLWLADPGRPFATRWLERERVLYVQLNQVADAQGQTMAQFGDAVLEELRSRRARGAIVDLRHNNGGTTAVSFAFIRALVRHEPLQLAGALAVLIGPRSYSATMDVAGRLEHDLDAPFVGWPTGGRPNTYSSERPFRLPYSGITGTVSERWHQNGLSGDDRRPWIAPDISVWPSWADVLAGRDPVLDAALGLIAGK
jgi:hypothetical protein